MTRQESHTHIGRIGPSPEYLKRKREKHWKSEEERVIKETHRRLEVQQELKTKYGENLVDYGLALFGNIKSTIINFNGEMVESDKISQTFTRELVESLNSQPEENKSEWLNGLFKDLIGAK